MSGAGVGFKTGGVHPREAKELAPALPLIEVAAPDKVQVPVTQHLGKPSTVVATKGQDVKVGDLLAQADGAVSCAVHSPVSGKVLRIFDGPVVGAYRVPIIEIMNDGKYTGSDAFSTVALIPWSKKSTFLDAIKAAGVVGMGGAAFPTHVKLSPPKDAKIDTLILNGCECEPYLTADDAVMRSRPAQVLAGAMVMASILGVRNIQVGVENNKPEAIAALNDALKSKAHLALLEGADDSAQMTIEVRGVVTRYPQGAEKQLIDALTNRRVGSGKLPFHVGVVVQNVGTAAAVFDAVAAGKPLFERVITVSGKAVNKPGNYMVRIGTPLQALIDAAGGAKESLAAIVAGGPMMGKSLRSLEAPVVKGMSGVLLLEESEIQAYEQRDCIRCGRCVEACPVNLVPCDIAAMAEFKRWADCANVMDCVECGCCQYVCPAHRNLVLYNRLAKYYQRRIKK